MSQYGIAPVCTYLWTKYMEYVWNYVTTMVVDILYNALEVERIGDDDKSV